MSRWNNGFTNYRNGSITSEKSLPQDGPNDSLSASVYSSETRKQVQLAEIRKSRGRFTSDFSVTYDMGNIGAAEHTRGSAKLPFVDFPGIRNSDGGDLRDINALGGGMPPGVSFVGQGIPSRKSEFNKELGLQLDHGSPVRRA